MKPVNQRLSIILAVMFLASIACSSQAAPLTATPTPAPTSTTLPTDTATPQPTFTSEPTATEIPPTATAVPMRSAAINEQYEVKVLYARYFAKISSGGFIYTPSDYLGKFLDVDVVVKNLQPGKPLNISWKNVYIIDKDHKTWYPNFGGSFASKNNDKFDPTTLFLFPYEKLENLVFDEYPLYLRAVWATDGQRPATFFFGFDTSNLVEVVIP